MPLHLIKLSVGIDHLEQLQRFQEERLNATGRLWHITRQTPRQAAALLDGGSIYWVIRGLIRGRQRLLGLEETADGEGLRRCRILLDPMLVATAPRPQRPFQGWRYLPAEAAPPDLVAEDSGTALPPELAADLRRLGLL